MIPCKRCGGIDSFLDGYGICDKCAQQMSDDIRVTDFNKDMTKDERNYYGEEYNDKR
jgi:Cys-tRNA synthase (O-phospho-L-seryl-tRNA:Cys-tRNA synthase)